MGGGWFWMVFVLDLCWGVVCVVIIMCGSWEVGFLDVVAVHARCIVVSSI